MYYMLVMHRETSYHYIPLRIDDDFLTMSFTARTPQLEAITGATFVVYAPHTSICKLGPRLRPGDRAATSSLRFPCCSKTDKLTRTCSSLFFREYALAHFSLKEERVTQTNYRVDERVFNPRTEDHA